MASPGDRLQTYFRHEHPDGSPWTGLTPSLTLLMGPGGALDASRYSWEDLGDGFYGLYVQLTDDDPVGDYEIHVTLNDDLASVYSHTWTVVASSAASGIAESRGANRRDIRISVARMLSDYQYAVAGDSGNTGQLTDAVRLAGEDGKFKGMQMHFSDPDSPHYGHIARVTAHDGPARTIYFEPPTASAIITGDRIDMYNYRSRGTTVDQYNASINDAISAARQQHYVIPVSYAVPDAFSRTAPEIEIPSYFISFTSLEATKHDGQKYRVRPGDISIDRMARTVTVTKPSAISYLNGLSLTMRGYAMPSLLDNDEDRTLIDLEWLYNEVKAQILERLVMDGAPVGVADRLFLQERQEAIGKRGLIVNRALPNTVRLL